MRRANLGTLLDDLARGGGREAFVLRTPYRRFAWSARQTRNAALSLAQRLRQVGLRPGECAILHGSNSPEWCAAFLGIVASGGVAVPLDSTGPPEFARKVARRVRARAIVASRSQAGLWQTEPAVPLVVLEDLDPEPPNPEFEPYPARPDETAQIVFTSGTTAEPRGVELTHANLLAPLEPLERGFRKREWYLRPLLPLRLMCWVPLSHLFGQALGLFIPVLFRSTSIFVGSLQSARLIQAIRRERPLAVTTVPRTLALLRDALERELERRGQRESLQRRLRRLEGRPWWRRAWAARRLRALLRGRPLAWVVGGAELEPELEAFFARAGYLIVQGYGMTEAAPIVAIHNPLGGRLHTIGKPIRGVEIRIAEDGELLVRGPNVMKGYYDDPEATGRALEDGWLRTGDLVERDAEGRLYFRGRKKDVIVTASGLNVYPTDVERTLEALPGVREAVVFAVPGEAGPEVWAAVLASGKETDTDQLRREANARLAAHQRLRRVVLWPAPDFPRTSTGKVRRGEVAAAVRWSRGEAAAGRAAMPHVATVLAHVRADLAAGVDPRARLAEDLGLDSVEILELLGLLEEELGVDMDEREQVGSWTVEDLERAAHRPAQPRLRIEMPRWGRRGPVRALRAALRDLALRPFFSLFVRLRVEGREGIRQLRGPWIVVANHTSMLDAPAVLFALARHQRGKLAPAMAIEVLPAHFDPAGHPWPERVRDGLLYMLAVLLFQAYPMPQRRGFRPSLEYTGELLDAGLWPLVFPEGRMTRDGKLLPFRKGIGLLVRETRAPVLPFWLEGLGQILAPGTRWPRRGTARVRVGQPFDPVRRAGSDDPARLTEVIEAAVRQLGGLGEDRSTPR